VSEVLRLTGPAVLTGLFQTLTFLADRVMLGRHSSISLGSMQISGVVMWSICSVFFGAMIGSVALVSRRVGAGEFERARSVAHAALRLAGAIGLIVGVSGSFGSGFIAEAMAPVGKGDTVVAATTYMRVGFVAFPAVFLAAAGSLILNGSGDTKTTFWIGAIANAVNIGVSYPLIYGFEVGPLQIHELGSAGAAIGTLLSYMLQCMLILIMLRRPSCAVQVRGIFLGPLPNVQQRAARHRARRELWSLSGPAVLERLAIYSGYVLFAFVVASLGATAMAANQVLLTLESICFLGAEGFGVAAATVMGQFLGRGDPEGSSCGGGFAALACALALSACGLVIWGTQSWTLPLFVAPGESGEELITAAAEAMPILVITQPMMAIALVLGHALRGAGDTRSPVIAAVVGGLMLRVGGSWILGVELELGLWGIWMATAIDWTVRAAILSAVFMRGRWKTLKL